MFTSLTIKMVSFILISQYAMAESNLSSVRIKIQTVAINFHYISRNDDEIIETSFMV